MGGVHLNAYANIPEVEVVGVADASRENAAAGAESIGARPYASYDELVSAEDVEVVDVCLPTAFHKDLALRAAGEGRHVILEKPIARTIEDAAGDTGRLLGRRSAALRRPRCPVLPRVRGDKAQDRSRRARDHRGGAHQPPFALPLRAGTTGMQTGA